MKLWQKIHQFKFIQIKLKIELFLKQRLAKLKLLTPETKKLLGKTKKILIQIKTSENVPKLESVEIVLVIVI